MNIYVERSKLLIEMGFANYKEYLKSPLWKAISQNVLRRDSYRCTRCGRRAWQVHHGSYTRNVLEGDDLTKLYSVCWQCHNKAEFRKGKKTYIQSATAYIRGGKHKTRKLKRIKYNLCVCGKQKQRHWKKCSACHHQIDAIASIDYVFGYDPNDEFSMPLF